VTIAPKNTSLTQRSLPAIFAMGSTLAAIPASAIELGELTVQSRLGQPLRASIAYALAPNEQLSDYCVTLRPGASLSGLPTFGAATVSVSNGVIMLAGKTPVREPMISAHIVVNCPYTANISREYLLFIDPLAPAYDKPAITQQVNTAAAPVAVAAEAIQRPAATVTNPVADKDIAATTRYRVQSGDTLSTIAARIQDRPVGLWPAVNAIFAANPDAFVNNDINRLKAGSWLSIPDFSQEVSVESVSAPATPAAVAETSSVTSPAVFEDSAVANLAPVQEAPSVTAESNPEPVLLDDLDSYEPQIMEVVESAPQQSANVIIDADLAGPETTSESPNVTTAMITTNSNSADGSASRSWLLWLAGSGVALILGLLMFGRRFRGESIPAPSAPQADQPYHRRASDNETTETESIEAVDVDFDLSDDSPTEENLILDADLVMGTGLAAGSSSDVTQDFGYAASTELDVELPFEPIAQVDDGTDILPPMRIEESSILKSEVLPEEDDYDMSVMIDATKMPLPDDITERDLKAVEVDIDDESMTVESYTINKEVDFQVLEQDYEDELTATQALNEEITRAAAELVAAQKLKDSSPDDDATTEMPLATVTELDITAQMPIQSDVIVDPDATGVNEAIAANDTDDDETAEMPIESGKVS
jgi:FimV-like protein